MSEAKATNLTIDLPEDPHKICRYCLGTGSDLTSDLIFPCNCKTPVCTDCLKYHVDLNKKIKCEICKEPFKGIELPDLSPQTFSYIGGFSRLPNGLIRYNTMRIPTNYQTYQVIIPDSDSEDENLVTFCQRCIGSDCKPLCVLAILFIIFLLGMGLIFNKRFDWGFKI